MSSPPKDSEPRTGQDPEQPWRRILAATKGNLGLPPVSLAFRLQAAPRLGVTRVVWEGSSPLTAADLLRASAEDDAGRSALGAARHSLREVPCQRAASGKGTTA